MTNKAKTATFRKWKKVVLYTL